MGDVDGDGRPDVLATTSTGPSTAWPPTTAPRTRWAPAATAAAWDRLLPQHLRLTGFPGPGARASGLSTRTRPRGRAYPARHDSALGRPRNRPALRALRDGGVPWYSRPFTVTLPAGTACEDPRPGDLDATRAAAFAAWSSASRRRRAAEGGGVAGACPRPVRRARRRSAARIGRPVTSTESDPTGTPSTSRTPRYSVGVTGHLSRLRLPIFNRGRAPSQIESLGNRGVPDEGRRGDRLAGRLASAPTSAADRTSQLGDRRRQRTRHRRHHRRRTRVVRPLFGGAASYLLQPETTSGYASSRAIAATARSPRRGDRRLLVRLRDLRQLSRDQRSSAASFVARRRGDEGHAGLRGRERPSPGYGRRFSSGSCAATPLGCAALASVGGRPSRSGRQAGRDLVWALQGRVLVFILRPAAAASSPVTGPLQQQPVRLRDARDQVGAREPPRRGRSAKLRSRSPSSSAVGRRRGVPHTRTIRQDAAAGPLRLGLPQQAATAWRARARRVTMGPALPRGPGPAQRIDVATHQRVTQRRRVLCATASFVDPRRLRLSTPTERLAGVSARHVVVAVGTVTTRDSVLRRRARVHERRHPHMQRCRARAVVGAASSGSVRDHLRGWACV